MNSINIIGRITADPELRRTQDNTAVCSYSLAVKRPRVKDASDFINCVTWRQGAEYLSQYGHKGDLVAVSGSLQSRKWQDKNGNNRTEWEVVTDTVELISSKKPEANTSAPAQNLYAQPSYSQQNFREVNIPDSQLPF